MSEATETGRMYEVMMVIQKDLSSIVDSDELIDEGSFASHFQSRE